MVFTLYASNSQLKDTTPVGDLVRRLSHSLTTREGKKKKLRESVGGGRKRRRRRSVRKRRK